MSTVQLICPRNWKTAFTPLRAVEEEQKDFFSRFVLYVQDVEVLEVTPRDKNVPEGTCAWEVKFRYNVKTEDGGAGAPGGLYDYVHGLIEARKPTNASIQELTALSEDTFFVTYNIKCTCECIN